MLVAGAVDPETGQRYRNKVSGSLLDLINMYIEVPQVSHDVLRDGTPRSEQASGQIDIRVSKARTVN